VGLLKPIRDYVDTLVHPSVQHDALMVARHRAFIAPRLLGSLMALIAFPAYLALRGVPSALEILVFAWLVVPIFTAYFLSRTGRYESAHTLSSLALTALASYVAFMTGGITSFAAIWLVIVPLEAALSASRRVVAIASTLALSAAAILMFCGAADLLPATPAQNHGALAALGISSATLYATGLALGAESLARTSFWLFYAEEDRYRLLARNMTDAITRHGPNGAVLFASPAAERLFGVSVNELMGHGLFDRVHVADRPAYLTAFSETVARNEEQSVEFRVRRDGVDAGQPRVEFIWIEMRCRPLDPGSTGQLPAREMVAVMRDVTERKAQEHGLEAARSEAERANAAKGRFLATMSHELRTPLNVIIGFSEMLMNEHTMQLDAARRGDYAKLINDSGHHLLSVVNGILDMSKIDTGEFVIRPEPFAPGPVIKNCCALFALKASDAGLEIKLELPDELPEINADQRALKQIMINLLSNAIKFTDRGGRLTVAARVESAHVLISVEDNGVGIGAEDLTRLGDQFFQARGSYDRRHDGTGLGLSIVKGLVALHAGQILVRSRPGDGTCFTVRLPLDCEKARASIPASKIVHHLVIEPTPAPAPVQARDPAPAVKISA
jgi:two-component system, cell cycle sensor histidine kinase DivJ